MKNYRNILGVFIFLLLPIGMFQNCADFMLPHHETEAAVNLSSYNEAGFKTTLQPFLLSNCSVCHNGATIGAPPFAVADEVSAIQTLISGNYVNTSMPASSAIVLKIANGHASSGLPTSLAPDLQAQIEAWAAGISAP